LKRINKAYWATIGDFNQMDTIYLVVGETRGKAKVDYMRLMGSIDNKDFLDIKLRRAKDKDFAFNGEQI